MDARAVGAELDAAHVALAIDWHRQHKHARYVRAFCWKDEWRRHRDDEVGLAELPAAGPRRCGGQVASITFARTVRDPSLECRDLRVSQGIQTDEPVPCRIDFPRRHDAIFCD